MEALSKNAQNYPGYTFDQASTRVVHPRRLGYMKPHICCYAAENFDRLQHSEPQSRSELGYAEFFIDVKPSPSHDYFSDPPVASTPEALSHDFVAPAEDEEFRKHRDRALGQHIAYVV